MQAYYFNKEGARVNAGEIKEQLTPRMEVIALSPWGYTGGGSKVATSFMIKHAGRWRRVYQDVMRSTNYAYNYIIVGGREISIELKH